MSSLVVAYQNLDQINNHELLLPSTFLKVDSRVEPIHCIVHRDPICTMSGNKVLTNYDFVVSPQPLEGFVRSVVLPRLTKNDQAIYLAERTDRTDLFPNFMKTRSWRYLSDLFNDASSFLVDKVVIKLMDGARGICQLLITGVKGVNKATLFSDFHKVMTKFNAKNESFSNAEEHTKALQKFFEEELNSSCKWSGLEERDFPNTLQYTDPSKYFMQEFYPNVEEEYRVLVGVNGEKHYFRRGLRKDRPFAQATGTNASVYQTTIDSVSELLRREIEDFIDTVVPAMNSADLFLIQTEKGLQYGLFEFCHQFGMDVDDPAIFKQMHSNFLIHHARQFRPDLFV